MNMKKRSNQLPFRSKIVVRLWLMMMLLVVLGVAFMLVAQIFLFEQNYIKASASEMQERLEPYMDKLKTKDLAGTEQLIISISNVINGKMMVIGDDGKLAALYSEGHKLDSQSWVSTNWYIQQEIRPTQEYKELCEGKPYTKIIRSPIYPISIEIGIPALYDKKQASVILYENLDQMQTVLNMNRSQLVILSVALTLVAAIAAALLSRHFVKPIRAIKRTVDSLAQGELTATPGLSLTDELGQLSGSVEALGQALQRVDVLRKEVIANVSHELRSPLALITGYAEMVRDINWKDEKKRYENLTLIIQEAGRMSEMVSDIMDYSQLQAGYIQLKKDWYNLCEIIESQIALCEKSAAENGIAIEFKSTHDDILICADAMKICQVIRNLLNNAVNHTADGEKVTVEAAETDNKIRVCVVNPGEPIPQEDRDIIWERYQRSQHHGGRQQGTGIGLSIVSTFLKAHDMDYGVDCQDGLTMFWFEYTCEKTSR